MLSNIVLKLKNTMDGYKNTSDEFIKDQRGVTAIEYAIIGVAVSAIVLAVFNGDLGTALQGAMYHHLKYYCCRCGVITN